MKPFGEGIKAFKTGKLGNPYNQDTTRNREWERGFNLAYFENLERVKNAEKNNKEKATS